MPDKHDKTRNFKFAAFKLMFLCAIATGKCTGESVEDEEELMTSSIYKKPGSKLQYSASESRINEQDLLDETIKISINNEALDSLDNENLESDESGKSSFVQDEEESLLLTRNFLPETMTSSIYGESGSKSQYSALNNQLDSMNEAITFSINNIEAIDSFKYENSENIEPGNRLLENDGKKSLLSTRNFVNRENESPLTEVEEINCGPQNKTDSRKTINISATTSTVTKISIIMDGDDDDDDDDDDDYDDDDDDDCTPKIAPCFTTETTTRKCSVCTSKNKDECNKENGNNFEQVPTRFVCRPTVTTEKNCTRENDNDTKNYSLGNQEVKLDDDVAKEEDCEESITTKLKLLSSTQKLRQRRNYNSYKNQLRGKPIYFKNKSEQLMSKEEKIQRIQDLLHDIKQKLEVSGNRLKGEMNELRFVKEKVEDFARNNNETSENNVDIDDDQLEKLRKALINQYKTENKFVSNDEWKTRNFENKRLLFDVQGKNDYNNFGNIHQRARLNSLELLDNKKNGHLNKELNYNEIWRGGSNLQNGNLWMDNYKVADYPNRYEGGSGRIYDFNHRDMNFQRPTINLYEEQATPNSFEVINSEILKRSVNNSQGTSSNVVDNKSNDTNNNIAAQENSSPVYISQIYFIDSNGTNSRIN